MKQRSIFLFSAAVLLGLAAFGYRWRAAKASTEQSDKTVRVREGRIEETVESTGEVVALNRVEIRPPISGRIDKLLVDEGGWVKSGEIMAWMSSSDRAAILDAARAKGPEEYKRWEDTYKPTPIVAPLSGTIIRKDVVMGQTVNTGSDLFIMADKLIVMAHVDEADIGKVKVGMAARISLDAYPEQSISGRVFNLRFEGKNVSNVITYGVKVEPNSVPPFFRSQMTANVRFVIRGKETALLLPASAVSEDKSGVKTVFITGPDGKPLAHAVKTGTENGEDVEITEGLKAGDEVLIRRQRYIAQRESTSPLIYNARRREGSGEGTARQGSRRP